MVNDPTINKVLVICDKGYKQKADEREGGVGTETQIITPNVYKEVNQEKFIPIVAERDENGDDFIPTYMASRKYIDLSNDELFIENYEQLLRTLYERPANRKPKKGTAPTFLFEEEEVNDYKFHFLLKQISLDLAKGRISAAKTKSIEFKNEFINSLKEFIVMKMETYELTAQEVEDQIDNMLILRDDYIELLEKLIAYDALSEDYLIDFLESIYNEYIDIKSNVSGSIFKFQFDNYKFFNKEIFLYTVSILLNLEKYQLLSEILYSRFFVNNDHSSNNKEGRGFEIFNSYIEALDVIQVKKSGSNYYSYSAEKISRRATKNYNSAYLANTDILLYYLSALKSDENNRAWFPHSYIYSRDSKIETLQKLESKRHFEKVKLLFEVESKEELIQNFNDFKNEYQEGYRSGLASSIPDIKYHIDYSKICEYR